MSAASRNMPALFRGRRFLRRHQASDPPKLRQLWHPNRKHHQQVETASLAGRNASGKLDHHAVLLSKLNVMVVYKSLGGGNGRSVIRAIQVDRVFEVVRRCRDRSAG
jgi:hypothetical protein